MKSFSRFILPILITLSALSVSASAAFYSVFGLSKLFAGASFEVIVMATSLEVSKLVIATLLHNYWKELNKLLRLYLTSAVLILIVITSMGIYGFLSSAYQETANQLAIVDRQIEFVQQKENFYQQDVDRYDSELARISSTINTLSNARAREIQVRDTSVAGGLRNTISTSEIRLAQERLSIEEQNRREVQESRTIAADSLQKFQLQRLELESNNEIAAELGPLKYISGLTGIPMDRIVNVLLLVIIFVFDPLAVSLVLAANSAFKIARNKKKDNTPVNFEPDNSRMDIIGQNGNTGEHYEATTDKEKTLNEEEDWVVVDVDDEEEQKLWDNTLEDGLDDIPYEFEESTFNEEYTGDENPPKIVKILQKTPSKRHVLLDNGDRLIIDKNRLDEDDLSIKYF